MKSQLFKSGLLAASVLLAACSLRHPKQQASFEIPEEKPVAAVAASEAVSATEPVSAAPVPETNPLDDGPKIELKPAKNSKSTKAIEITDAIRSSAPSSTEVVPEALASASETTAKDEKTNLSDKTNHAIEIAGVEPNQSLRWLQNGNKRFVKGYLRADGQSQKDVKRLAKSQRPHAIVLSCSDSRVPPELVFDQKLGEVFTIRTAGEVADDNVIASIEYAIAHLGPRLLVVMGHTSCGAVKAAVSTLDGSDAGSPSLNHMVEALHPHLREVLAEGTKPSSGLERESWAAAQGVASDLMKRSGIIAGAVKKGQLLIKVGLYHLDSGVVDFQ